jgi:phenylpyruvate tautomerase PptA (4-oxalocrotonate tautomerase family)
VPYIHAGVTTVLSTERKRSLIQAITATVIRVLEVPPPDVHVFVWELLPENLGCAGEEPGAGKINNFSVVFRRGREPQVRRALIEQLTDAVQSELGVLRGDIHIIVVEVPPEDIGEGGVLMKPPAQPSWYTNDPRCGRPVGQR